MKHKINARVFCLGANWKVKEYTQAGVDLISECGRFNTSISHQYMKNIYAAEPTCKSRDKHEHTYLD